ncbi:hypothetical protein CYMTET_20479 [Cymbomonas tetramitiformis]|uniref:Methyltransferase n=1 Tax=Cymbomonas tetramitiformis TaxID=36881 RepID=A0AAE0G3Y8_9CHLO|nr:hypothetical protein CYMTET_20479 [Cymbomonas tetramitiformis]
MVFVAMALIALHLDYVYIKTKFTSGRLPTLSSREDEVCAHFDNITVPSVVVAETGAGIADNWRRQGELSCERLNKKAECPIRHKRGQESKIYFRHKQSEQEDFFKWQPDVKEITMKKEYQKHGKLPVPDKASIVADSDQHLGRDGTPGLLYLFDHYGELGMELAALRATYPTHHRLRGMFCGPHPLGGC